MAKPTIDPKDGSAENADAVVCGDIAYGPEGEHTRGVCADCGRPIVWHESSPKKPRKICGYCFLKLTEGNQKEIHTMLSPDGLERLQKLGLDLEDLDLDEKEVREAFLKRYPKRWWEFWK